jgi:hypothetical protein
VRRFRERHHNSCGNRTFTAIVQVVTCIRYQCNALNTDMAADHISAAVPGPAPLDAFHAGADRRRGGFTRVERSSGRSSREARPIGTWPYVSETAPRCPSAALSRASRHRRHRSRAPRRPASARRSRPSDVRAPVLVPPCIRHLVARVPSGRAFQGTCGEGCPHFHWPVNGSHPVGVLIARICARFLATPRRARTRV